VRTHTKNVLRQRKGDGYAVHLIEHCTSQEELPATIVNFLTSIFEQMKLPSLDDDENSEDGPITEVLDLEDEDQDD
jgi:hypothetical protein